VDTYILPAAEADRQIKAARTRLAELRADAERTVAELVALAGRVSRDGEHHVNSDPPEGEL
jgi:hypothetical protein